MGSRRVNLCGVAIDVETEHEDFGRYLEAQFPDAAPAENPPDIAVRVRWTEGVRAELTPEVVFPGWPADVRIDRHVWLAERAVLCLRADDAPQIAIAGAPGAPRRFEVRFHFSLDAAGWRASAKRV